MIGRACLIQFLAMEICHEEGNLSLRKYISTIAYKTPVLLGTDLKVMHGSTVNLFAYFATWVCSSGLVSLDGIFHCLTNSKRIMLCSEC